MYQAGLVLEGGGMKGIYTCGVLDFFLEKGIEFSSVYGVSMGACDMCSYLSKQHGRGRDIIIDYVDQKGYCSVESLVLTGDLFNADMCYHLIPDYLNPFDYEAYKKYEGKAYSVVTNIRTGEPEYLQVKDMKADIEMIRASASLPLVARVIKIDNEPYLDGGISDSIPLKKSIADGNQKNVVVMTKEVGFYRKPLKKAPLALIKTRYLKYPKVYELMRDRHIHYNKTLEEIEKETGAGRAFVIRPQKKVEVGRVERDKNKLNTLYEEGYQDAVKCFDDLKRYLERQD